MKEVIIQARITSRDSEAFNRYLKDVDAIPVLTPDEETEVALLASQGDKKAIDRLVEANLRFVISVAKLYANDNTRLEDLVNEGNIGLMKAAKRFDPSRGFKFISYAVWWIRQSILDFKSNLGTTVKLPAKRYRDIGKIQKVSDAFEQEHHRRPSVEELVDLIDDMTESKIKSTVNMDDNIANSLDKTMTDDGFTLMDVMEDNLTPRADHLTKGHDKGIIIDGLLHFLPDRERNIIVLFYGLEDGLPLELNQIADRIGLTKERTRQLKEIALKRIKNHVKTNNLSHLREGF